MKRLIIICEGQTELEFCKDVLYPYFFNQGVFIQTPLIKKSGGGIVSWGHLRDQIRKHLFQDGEAFVTTLVDFYGIHKKHAFPNWEDAKLQTDKFEKMAILERGMAESIEDPIRRRFIPYIQLHEFEGLLFTDLKVFEDNFTSAELLNKAELVDTINRFPNPELINESPNNAPSYRLKRLISGYNKIVHGAIIAEEIGLERIRAKSHRFNDWISQLETGI